MILLLDEQLSYRVAGALRAVRLDAFAVGEDGWPELGSTDSDVVAACVHGQAVLVTQNDPAKDREMREALRRHRAPVVLIKPPVDTPRELLHALLACWDDIERGFVELSKLGQHVVIDLDPKRLRARLRDKRL